MKKMKEYLNKIKILDDKIDRVLMKKNALYAMLTSINTKLGDNVNVQTSKDNDKMASTFVKIIECESQIDALVDEFVDYKTKVIEELYRLTDLEHINLLKLRYFEYLSFQEIADRLNVSYDYCIELHKRALIEFSRCVSHEEPSKNPVRTQ